MKNLEDPMKENLWLKRKNFEAERAKMKAGSKNEENASQLVQKRNS